MTPRDRYRLAGETGCSPQTVERWALGGVMTDKHRRALEAAAAKLGIVVPNAAGAPTSAPQVQPATVCDPAR